ncbi:phage tail assembly chaperone [Novosphingobium aerophilum]|uniref:phage tail assembly chaperone n=1 Tax=Novosphingobium TaxID=165696 RepID=UPI002D7838A6|nr:phage tail assembly chaperone [Novosphingobium sp. RL4]WRT93117.1 phage tail assembly chaperone [Novosphingobium sp. RL4]
MSETRLAPAALRLCGLAARQLGWRPRDFWAATPAELAAALGLLPPGPAGAADAPGVDRSLLDKLMEHDNER